eukprot:CAMPEP_0183474534 /NCGR_PEP_ID=MMETSP0370-20130417/163253_1 /TAXON_ID=268820 /ORGANISM="Peridinium aciculiferum, Strain PAER-2" /LENGTH=83 /DNA_ID=CAMNT_0025667271 /DNA_START=1 /DNA_END=248 /DNA_ORIENTATION=+
MRCLGRACLQARMLLNMQCIHASRATSVSLWATMAATRPRQLGGIRLYKWTDAALPCAVTWSRHKLPKIARAPQVHVRMEMHA